MSNGCGGGAKSIATVKGSARRRVRTESARSSPIEALVRGASLETRASGHAGGNGILAKDFVHDALPRHRSAPGLINNVPSNGHQVFDFI
jgi:hypothetical protein